MQPDSRSSLLQHLGEAFRELEGGPLAVGVLQQILSRSHPEQAEPLALLVSDTVDAIHRRASSLRQSQGTRESWLSASLKEINESNSSPDPAFRGVRAHLSAIPLADSLVGLAAQFLGEPPPVEEDLGVSSRVQAFLISESGAPVEAEISKVATAVAIASGLISSDPVEVQGAAAAIDIGLTAIKAAYQVAAGTSSITDALEAVVDRSTVAVVALTEQMCAAGGTTIGAALGSAVAMIFSPGAARVGRMVGAAVGRFAGEFVGRVASEMIRAGVEKFTPLAKDMLRKADGVIQSVAGGMMDTRRWVISLFG